MILQARDHLRTARVRRKVLRCDGGECRAGALAWTTCTGFPQQTRTKRQKRLPHTVTKTILSLRFPCPGSRNRQDRMAVAGAQAMSTAPQPPPHTRSLRTPLSSSFLGATRTAIHCFPCPCSYRHQSNPDHLTDRLHRAQAPAGSHSPVASGRQNCCAVRLRQHCSEDIQKSARQDNEHTTIRLLHLMPRLLSPLCPLPSRG